MIYNDVVNLRSGGAATPAVTMISPWWVATGQNAVDECECGGAVAGCTYDPATNKYWTNCLGAIENQINALASIRIASVVPATNQNVDACTTSPTRMGYGGSYASTYKTITVGGTMYHSGSSGTVDARWTCAAQPGGCDSWGAQNPGSAYGSCVSIWAPAWNIQVAGGGGPNDFRGGNGYGPVSGTSWSAPYVAGVVARLLDANSYWTVSDVWNRLVSDANSRYYSFPGDMPGFDPGATFNNKLVYIAPAQ